METRLSQGVRGRLERSCGHASEDSRGPCDRIRIGSGAEGIERLEAHFFGQAFAPHRHDTYAVGLTLTGVQTFRYRGERRQCLPGQCHILHPDETHDGGAGTDTGFGYRIVYIDPALVQDALGGRPLPFVSEPVIAASALPTGFISAVWDIDEPIQDVGRTEIAVAVADMLAGAATGRPLPTGRLHFPSLASVREVLAAHPAVRHSMEELERIADLDRWTLARQFRAAFGTSPSRFRTMRQLDRVRRLLKQGTPPAEASAAAGFADQSHMSRHFKRTYGLTPAAWAAAVRGDTGERPKRPPAATSA
jgi:AraC-like DNA-binding protein